MSSTLSEIAAQLNRLASELQKSRDPAERLVLLKQFRLLLDKADKLNTQLVRLDG